MRKYFKKEYVIGLIILGVVSQLFTTYMEMTTYNKLSNRPDVTFIEALFNDLEIDVE